jgi:3D (Asp-Asp-Asp) domain-containing protein
MAKQGKRIIATTPDLSLPFGTRVRIEGHIYEVWDRMPTSRYDFQRKRRVPQTQAVDIFTFDYAEAMRLGRRQVQMEVLDD